MRDLSKPPRTQIFVALGVPGNGAPVQSPKAQSAAATVKPLQHGHLQIYLLYILVTLVALLLWMVLS